MERLRLREIDVPSTLQDLAMTRDTIPALMMLDWGTQIRRNEGSRCLMVSMWKKNEVRGYMPWRGLMRSCPAPHEGAAQSCFLLDATNIQVGTTEEDAEQWVQTSHTS